MASNQRLGGNFAVFRAALLAGLALPACSTPTTPNESVASASGALINGGIATTAATPDIAAVAVLSTSAFGSCSATLIAPRTLLTAAHCFFPTAHGCQVNLGVQTATFADAAGNPNGAVVQTINVLGVSAHPDAYGFDPSTGNPGRVAACPEPAAPPAACPDPTLSPNAFNLPSCALVKACYPTGVSALPACVPNMPCASTIVKNTIGGAWGLKTEHDIALVYLESDPVGIAPMPVLTRGWSAPSRGIFEATAAAFDPWVAGNPIITAAGYGIGPKAAVSRDVGTMTLAGGLRSIPPPPDCAGVVGAPTVEAYWSVTSTAAQASMTPGDSGGPIMFGSAAVPAGPMATALPVAAGLTERRYLVGVNSMLDGGPSLSEASNAAWLKSRLDDFDGDGITNSRDNCVGTPNPDQANCNADAEKDRQAVTLGDACDPVPCPNADPVVTQSFSNPGGIVSVKREIRDRIQLDTVGSHNFYNGFQVADPQRQTYFRFCQPNAARGVTCAQSDGQQTHPQFHEVATGTPTNPWLPVKLKDVGVGVNPLIDYPSRPGAFTWEYLADYSSWRTNNFVDAAPSNVLGSDLGGLPYTGLDGIFGLRAGDASEVLGTGYRPDNGVHPSVVFDVYRVGAAMARHYFPLSPDKPWMTLKAPVATCAGLCLPACPQCGLFQPIPECITCGPALRRPLTEDPFVLLPVNERWGLINRLLAPSDASSRLSPNLRGKFADATLRFVPRIEPGTLNTALVGNTQGVFVSKLGTSFDSKLVSTLRGLALENEPLPAIDPAIREATVFQMALPVSATVQNAALGTFGGSLLINDRVKVFAASTGYATVTGLQGLVRVGADAKVGNVFGDQSVELRARATVTGSLWAATSLTADTTALVTGSKTVAVPISDGQSESWPVYYPNTNQGLVGLEPNQTRSLAPGAFGDTSVKNGAKLSLRSGSYFFQSLTLEPSSTLELDNRNGALFIYVRNQLIYRGKTVELAPTLPNVLFGVVGSEGVTVEAPFRGTVVAPNAAVTLATVGAPGHVGAFYGRSLEVHQDNTVQHRPFKRADCSSTFGCMGGWEPVGPTSSVARSLGISARVDFVPLYSARTSQLYLVGGTFAGTSTNTGQIVVNDVASGATRVLALSGYSPEKVLGASSSFSDDRLWVLDEQATGVTRLTHIDPLSGLARVVWQGTRSGGYDRYWLSVDLDGSLLLFASSLSAKKFATLRVRWLPFTFDSEKLYLVRTGNNGLVGAGIPSRQGITYFVAGTNGAVTPQLPATAAESLIQDLGPWL